MTATPPTPGQGDPHQGGWPPQEPAQQSQPWPQQGGWPQHPDAGQWAQQGWPQQPANQQQAGQHYPQQQWPPQEPAQQWPQQNGWAQQPAPQQEAYAQVPVGVGAAQAGGQQPVWGPQGYAYAQPPSGGEFGYQYGEVPQYPQPQFPTPSRPPQRGVPAWVWIMCATLVVAVITVFALPAFLDRSPGGDPTSDPTPTSPPDDGFGQPNSSPSGTFGGEHMVTGMNQALAARDRAAFFRFVEGSAVEPLNLWWDNMDVLQWSAGAFSVIPGQSDSYADDTISLDVTLGAVTAGSPVIPAESDHPDAGKAYAPSNTYTVTIRVTDDGESGVITGWELASTAAPWDLEPLYAVVSDHSVTAGYLDERDLIDNVAPLGDTAADWVIGTYQSATGIANAQRFTTFVSNDSERFNDWFIEDTSGWLADRSGTMFPQWRPFPAPGISEDIATGDFSTTAGGILTVGPNALLYGEDETLDTIVHEYVHAMQTTNTPVEAWPGSTAVEGWATYAESVFRGDGEFAAPGTNIGYRVRECVAEEGFSGEFPVQNDFIEVETVGCAYVLSGSIYAYAASLGADVFDLSDYVVEEGVTISEASAETGGPAIAPDGWADWLRSTYG